MRLNLRLTANTEPVPSNHLHRLTGALHTWIGWNEAHDGLSLYAFGWLQGGQRADGHLTFPRGATWRVSFYDTDVAKRLLDGIMQAPTITAGMRVFEVKEQAVPQFSGCYRFKVDAPAVARRTCDDGSRAYLTWQDEAADAVLTRVLRKLEVAGFEAAHRDARVQFDRTYRGARTKLAEIKGVKHRGSICPVVVEGPPRPCSLPGRWAWAN